MGVIKGKTSLMVYLEKDMREWIRGEAFVRRTSMTAVVTQAVRREMAKQRVVEEKRCSRGSDEKRQAKAATAKTAG